MMGFFALVAARIFSKVRAGIIRAARKVVGHAPETAAKEIPYFFNATEIQAPMEAL